MKKTQQLPPRTNELAEDLLRNYRASRLVSKANKLGDRAFKIWSTYVTGWEKSMQDPAKLQNFRSRTDGAYENTLTAWVQREMLRGLSLSNLTNRDEILEIISDISEPNVSEDEQRSLFRKLANECARAMMTAYSGVSKSTVPSTQTPAAATPAATPQSTTQPPAGPSVNFEKDIEQYIDNLNVDLNGLGQVARQMSASRPEVDRTNNAAADALLLQMGFILR